MIRNANTVRRGVWVALACAMWALGSCTRAESPPQSKAKPVECDVELRSWVVAGRGRHLYLECDCPDGYERFEDRIEFTSAALRWDFDGSRVADAVHRIARMTRGAHLHPVMHEPDGRLEARWRLDIETVERLQADRVFAREYRLLGPNSNSGMRWVAEHCGVTLPQHVLSGGGMLGEFPGIEMDPGAEVPQSLWESVGVVVAPG